MFDLGDTVPLTVQITDDAGALTNATTVTLTVTRPDGTTETPTVANPPTATGVYLHDYAPTQAGRHTVRWVSSGPAAAYTDSFDVRSAASSAIISLASAKKHLNIDPADTTDDEELRGHIEAVTDVIESITGPVLRRTVTQKVSGAGRAAIVLTHRPVISVTSVTLAGITVDPGGYDVSDAGVLTRVSGYSQYAWPAGTGNITIVYVAGRPVVPASILEAAKELIRINFQPQRGGSYSPFDRVGGGGDELDGLQQGTWRLGFFIPNRVMQLLMPHADIAGFA